MSDLKNYEAIVVGAGPNGLAAAITLARAGRGVLVIEAKDTVGGGARTAQLTLPGFWHDTCSAVHPLGVASPFLRSVPLEKFGLAWVHPEVPLAHPLDDGSAVLLERSIQATGENLGRDARAYERLMRPLVDDYEKILADLLGPFPFPPRHLLATARFGWSALRSARGLAENRFTGERARAMFAGLAAHSMLPLEKPATASFGLMLGLLGHAAGWPFPLGGSQSISNALAGYLRSLGGEIQTGREVESCDEFPQGVPVLYDITPRQLLKIAGKQLPAGYRRTLEHYRYGPGVFKIDYALDGAIPWKAEACGKAGTVHLGGTLAEIAASERAVWDGRSIEKPFVLVAQQSLFDGSRAPAGKHTAWAYCHMPNGSTLDMTGCIEAQIERFAPGFKDCILARSARSPAQMEQYNANYIGGDINGGVQDLGQLFTRPAVRWDPYSTPARNVFICSSATPPGGGVHGMCGYHAAQSVLKKVFGKSC